MTSSDARVYAKIESWHILDGDPGEAKTRCGLEVPSEAETDVALRLDEKSCETCLRLVEHDADHDEGEVEPDPEE